MERQAVQLKGNVNIIGAGFGGLSCAIRLASQGVQVTILERQDRVGGKLQQIEREGYHFDRGPSTITMPSTFRSVFDHAGVAMEDYVQLYELEPRTRNISANGTVVDLSGNRGWMRLVMMRLWMSLLHCMRKPIVIFSASCYCPPKINTICKCCVACSGCGRR
ncbi:phytoene desaturase family protein [Paenibacillus sp. QZ-Y1]|uniref:phytoene desaturase family protein n=1 Tax=Paenibacillus sp. QZ-Y1 TaxID=3414511 RepID=UPI003F7971DD